ncbi:MAG: adenine-specific methyltransferase EcoRI family protein, partial [Bifidobacteriaceae bacterium]|nr:adenine-specific methyltransferase EcoRI family protein [Bifidobacteriaceae bacterium]
MANANLTSAKRAKNDEFYTQWADIEREVNAYLEYNPDVFRGKVVLLPCDDPEWSNFTKFFALHFADFGLKKLISTSYAPDSNAGGAYYQPTLFGDPQFDEARDLVKGKLFVLEADDVNQDGVVNIEDLRWRYLEGDGDFRGTEVTKLRDEADFIITNPPFSLFREFVA